jgi:hypothetical protein
MTPWSLKFPCGTITDINYESGKNDKFLLKKILTWLLNHF